MLGLDSKTLAVPDYEITARLERLLMNVQPGIAAVPVVPIGNPSIRSIGGNRPQTSSPHVYHHHYPPVPPSSGKPTQPIRSAIPRRRSPSPQSRRAEASHRARSLSPLHVGFDPRTY